MEIRIKFGHVSGRTQSVNKSVQNNKTVKLKHILEDNKSTIIIFHFILTGKNKTV